MSDGPTPLNAASNLVATRLEAIQRRRREQEELEQQFETRIREPVRLLRQQWDAAWTCFLNSLRSAEAGALDNAGRSLSEIGGLVRRLDELTKTKGELSPYFLDAAALTEGLRQPTRAERLDALAADDRFLSQCPPLAAGLLSAAVGGQQPAVLTGLLQSAIELQEEITGYKGAPVATVVGWFPFLRDRLFSPPGREIMSGVFTCEDADPECNFHIRDYQRAGKFFAANVYLRNGQRLELDSDNEPTCFVVGRIPPLNPSLPLTALADAPDDEPNAAGSPSPPPDASPSLPDAPPASLEEKRRRAAAALREFARLLPPRVVAAQCNNSFKPKGVYEPACGLSVLSDWWREMALYIEDAEDTPPAMATSAPTEEAFTNEVNALRRTALCIAGEYDPPTNAPAPTQAAPTPSSTPPTATQQDEAGEPKRPSDSFAELRQYARDALKGQERAVVEALCDASGELPLADLALKKGVDWNGLDNAKKGFTNVQRRLKTKLQKRGWILSRHDNAAKLVKPKARKTC